jgi:hypothetical protein
MKTRRVRRSRRRHRSRRRRMRGGIAPVSAPTTILSFDEQAKIYLNPQIHDFCYWNDFLDSRTPLMNTAVKYY